MVQVCLVLAPDVNLFLHANRAYPVGVVFSLLLLSHISTGPLKTFERPLSVMATNGSTHSQKDSVEADFACSSPTWKGLKGAINIL